MHKPEAYDKSDRVVCAAIAGVGVWLTGKDLHERSCVMVKVSVRWPTNGGQRQKPLADPDQMPWVFPS